MAVKTLEYRGNLAEVKPTEDHDAYVVSIWEPKPSEPKSGLFVSREREYFGKLPPEVLRLKGEGRKAVFFETRTRRIIGGEIKQELVIEGVGVYRHAAPLRGYLA